MHMLIDSFNQHLLSIYSVYHVLGISLHGKGFLASGNSLVIVRSKPVPNCLWGSVWQEHARVHRWLE